MRALKFSKSSPLRLVSSYYYSFDILILNKYFEKTLQKIGNLYKGSFIFPILESDIKLVSMYTVF